MAVKVKAHRLIGIRSGASVQDAARLMATRSIGALGVLGPDKHLLGIITERDLAWFVAQASDPAETPVKDIVNDFPVVVGPISEADALERMRAARIRHLIVRQGDEFGIVSLRDFLLVRSAGDQEPRARDVMTSPAVACRADAYFEEIADILADRNISGMPVVNDAGSVVGVISERDLAHAFGGPMVRLAVRRHDHGPFMRDLRSMPRGIRYAKDIMTSPPLTVAPDEHLDEIARLMRIHQVNRVPVVDAGRLIGVVTRGDVLGAMGHLERAEMNSTRDAVVLGGRWAGSSERITHPEPQMIRRDS